MRHRLFGAVIAAAALFIAYAAPARADDYPVKDGTGASQTFCSKLVGGLQYPCHLIYGMFGSTPTPVTSDGTNLNVHVQVSDLPAGAATASAQASQLSQETAANTVLGLQADSAWSGTGSGSMVAIQKYIAAKMEATRALLAGTLTVQFASPQAVTQSGTWNITNVSGTVSLPTGAATAANQTSANTKLDQLHTDLTAATPAGSNLIGKVGIDQTTPGSTNAVSPQYGASGVSPVTGALASSTKTAAFTPIAGRPFYLELTGTGSAVVEVQFLLNDGTTYAAEVVATDGASPTVLNSISYSGGTRNGVRIALQVAQSGMSVKAAPGTVTGTVNFAFVQ